MDLLYLDSENFSQNPQQNNPYMSSLVNPKRKATMQNDSNNFSIDSITLHKILSELETISKDQKRVGDFVGTTLNSIRKWIVFFGVLMIIQLIIGFLTGFIFSLW